MEAGCWAHARRPFFALADIEASARRKAAPTYQTRLLIEAQLQGLKLGRLGTLKVAGLEGDVWRAFTVRELSISDARGVWLSADHVAVRWSYAPLFGRKLRVQDIRARHVLVLRRPELGPKQASKALPVSVQIDAVAAEQVRAIELHADCLLPYLEEHPADGYLLVRMFAQEMEETIQSTRLRLLDVYGRDRDRVR